VAKALYIGILLAILAVTPGSANAAPGTGIRETVAAEETILSPADVTAGHAAFKQAKRNKFDSALKALEPVQNPLLAKIIRWMEMAEPGRRGNFADVSAFIADNPDWPSQMTLKQRAERSLPTDMPREAVLAWFKAQPPITVQGAIRFAQALREAGDDVVAAALLRDTWIEQDFTKYDERYFRRLFNDVLRHEDELMRLDRLLWDRRASAAKRQAQRLGGGYPALAQARLSLAYRRGGVDSAIQRVPKELADDPGLIFERARWRQRKGRYEGVLELLDPPNTNAPRPENWWPLRHWTARQALVKGDISAAYRIASAHGLTAGVEFAEAEWLAGWIALRFLDQAETAYTHFNRLHEGVSTPISQARAAYWAGEAARALDTRDPSGRWLTRAGMWYAAAAHFKTTFYGQLANRRLGLTPDVNFDSRPMPDAAARAAFSARDVVQAIRVLGELGESDLQKRFIKRLSAISLSETDYTLTAELAQREQRPDLAVRTAKDAVADGILLLDHLFPFPVLPEGTSPEQALVLAVVRQESAFDTGALSSAGAHGLMQILPRTARSVARSMKLRYNRKKLRADPEYNMKIGRAYLSNLTNQYDGSYILAMAAYNAGPSRANSWIRAFGDPRDPDVDPIDWIESIPFDETRNYVQRILEGLIVYRQQLGIDVTAIDPFANLPAPATARIPQDHKPNLSCCL
jgi:soluble lytic murein transglycosylase